MTFDSIQTVESARQVLADIVTEHLKVFPHRSGILVAVLGAELSKRGLRGIHHKFGSEKLADFVRDQCQPLLHISRAPSGSDFLVGLADAATRTEGRPTATTGWRETVEPRVWKAVLSDRAPSTFIGPDRRVVVGEAPGADGWKQVPFMSSMDQGAFLEQVRANLELVANEEVRNAIISVLQKAKAADAPILEFSNTMTSIYRCCQTWNRRRIDAVFQHVADATGVDLRTAEVPRPASQPVSPEQERPITESRAERRVPPATPVPADETAGLRRMVKEAVETMSLHDLLELRLPVGSIHSALSRRGAGTTS